ncbi:olfactory receptor 52A1-like [Microcaecilia unicolor]|uniref:Olfactory receptor n=1 Tax=Microcaecilia unicolor TaxID=1415580 RepID=A0A6P7XRP0_9AMPH|nr:olfactory receptor 52A1-like [Microcaecilia unicolor]
MISSFNSTIMNPSVFTLIGIPGLETLHYWIAIPFCVLYIIALLGNAAIMTVITVTSTLHEPMFIFLFLLAFNDVCLCSTIIPKMLGIFWFNFKEINMHGCLAQMYFIHVFTGTESGVLLAMAFDRYVAICNPLRYGSIMTTNLIAKIGMVLLLRPAVLVAPFLFLIKRFSFYKTNVISHSYCEHMAVVTLVQEDVRLNSAYGLFVAFFVIGIDVILISLSYIRIFKAVFVLPSKEARLKAFSTCIPHICVFLMFYALALFSFLSHRYGKSIPHYIHIILSNLYLLLPPALNPMVYGVKTKQIRNRAITLIVFWKRII